MATYTYYSNGKLQHIPLTSTAAPAPAPARRPARASAARPAALAFAGNELRSAMKGLGARTAVLFNEPGAMAPAETVMTAATTGPTIIPTESIALDGASKNALKWLREKHGFVLVDEGSFGKALLRAPESGPEAIAKVFAVSKELYERPDVQAAHPNFVRVYKRIARMAAGGNRWWNLKNDGAPGVVGADVSAHDAWVITRGRPEIRVAVLDEGVDTAHPSLRAAVVAEHDLVDDNAHARPDGNDAHGTACAGIILSRDGTYVGLAPECSLVAVRFAKGDGKDGWVIDDFAEAKAIEWAWEKGKADVLSNSWSGGPPVDGITRAIDRARTEGRGGKGAVVIFAAGNENRRIEFPANLPSVLTVGASNWFDKRKAPNSADGEPWGSCYGDALDLMAPGVGIATTDIQGKAGYTKGDFVDDFNGTSSATPHAAAAAALVLSIAPDLKEARVRKILTGTCDRINASGQWDKYVGHGRLNLHKALRRAQR